MRSDPLQVDDLDELDEADLEEAPASPPRHETPPPPPLPTRRDLAAPAEPDLSDVFAAITPKKLEEKVPLPPGVKERKRAMLVTSPMPRRAEPARTRRLQEPGESTVAIPPPPRVPTIAGPALPPPPTMTPPPVSVRVRPHYASSLSAIAIDRPASRSMSVPPRAYGMPSTTPWAAIGFAAAVCVLAITGGGFAFGFSRAAAKSESATSQTQPREYDTAAVTSLDTTSATDKGGVAADKPEPKPLAFGTIRFADAPAGALVDGAPRKIAGGVLVLTCGPHRIKRPGHPTQLVSVPCNGSTTL